MLLYLVRSVGIIFRKTRILSCVHVVQLKVTE